MLMLTCSEKEGVTELDEAIYKCDPSTGEATVISTNGSYVLAERDEFSLELKISKPLISQIIIYTEDDDYNWNLSRENYNEARRLCVKLFKGE